MRKPAWTWAFAAASLAAAAALVWGIVVLRGPAPQRDLLAHEIVSSHVRSLITGRLVDVPSSDRHTVKPWFSGKIDFAPQVKDVSAQGFPLVGGRLDYVDQRPVAALVFQRRKHVINLFIWPPSRASGSGQASLAMKGFNVVNWTDAGLTFWAVSDVAPDDLREFARLYRE